MKNNLKKTVLLFTMLFAFCAISIAKTTPIKAENTCIVKQTKQTTTSITLSWTAVPGASYYEVRVAGEVYAQTKNLEYTVHFNKPGIKVGISIVAYSDECILSYSNYLHAATEPINGKVIFEVWNPGTTTPLFAFDFRANATRPDRMEIELKNAKNQLVRTLDIAVPEIHEDTVLLNIGKEFKNAPFIMRIRPYYVTTNGKVYGAWNAPKAYVPQPTASGKHSYFGSSKTITLKWAKMKGAESYSVYRSTKRGKLGKKVITTKKNSFKETVPNKKYYYYILANNVKVGGKKYNSTKSGVFYEFLLTR